jgi:antitoxin MazE
MSTASAPINTQISTWGNGLALRLTKPVAALAGVVDGTPVQITAGPGRIVIEVATEPSLEQMLAAFDPVRHGGELMAGGPVGAEVVR